MERLSRVRAALLACVALSACSANHHSIYRVRELSDSAPTVITVDAKQRAILSSFVPYKPDGTVDPKAVRRFCSEPSPDVFSVVAQSMSAGGSLSKGTDPTSIQAALNLAYSSAEQGSTIARTQTINMLRELMFRTCERYVSGGYDAKEMSIQAIRDQRLMVSILAIEQLTGAVTPKPAVIAATGSAGAGVSGDAIVRLDDARKAKEAAESDYASAEKAYADEDKDGACATAEGAATPTDADKAKVKTCADKRTAKATALDARAKKTAIYTEMSNLARAGGVAVLTNTASDAQGGLDTVSPKNVTDVANAVSDIVTLNFKDDSEVMMFCLKFLYDAPPTAPVGDLAKTSLGEMCMTYLTAKVFSGAENSSPGITAALQSIKLVSYGNFTKFWTAARHQAFGVPDKRNSFTGWLQSQLLATAAEVAVACFTDAGDETDKVKECFAALPQGVQRKAITINDF